jgi:hypothetical protein
MKKSSDFWKDPVWSKVIAAGVIAVITALISLIKSLLNQTDFQSSLFSIWSVRIELWKIIIFIFLFYAIYYSYLEIKNKRNIFHYDRKTLLLDTQTFEIIRTELIPFQTIADLKSNTFSSNSFEVEKLDFIYNILNKNKDPNFEFINPALERDKAELINAVDRLDNILTSSIFGTGYSNWVSIPKEWDYDQFHNAAKAIELEENNVSEKIEQIIKHGRRALKV